MKNAKRFSVFLGVLWLALTACTKDESHLYRAQDFCAHVKMSRVAAWGTVIERAEPEYHERSGDREGVMLSEVTLHIDEVAWNLSEQDDPEGEIVVFTSRHLEGDTIPFIGPLAVDGEPLRGLLFIGESTDGLSLQGTYHLEDEMLVGWESEWHLEDFLALVELVEARGSRFNCHRFKEGLIPEHVPPSLEDSE